MELQLAVADQSGEVRVDLFQVDVRDPTGGELDHLHRVDTGECKVTGVDAKRYVGLIEDSLDVVAAFYRHSPVWMQGSDEAIPVCDLNRPLEAGQEDIPFALLHFDPVVMTGVMRIRSQDHYRSAHTGHCLGSAFDGGKLTLDVVGAVEHHWYETAYEIEAISGEQ